MKNPENRMQLRTKRLEDSIRARFDALSKALQHENYALPELVAGCRTAALLQQLEIPTLGIHRVGSRNTMIKYANRVLETSSEEPSRSGWAVLNELRVATYRTRVKTQNPRSVSARNRRLIQAQEMLQSKLDQSDRLMLAQSKAYLWVLKEVRGLAFSKSVDSQARDRLQNLLKTHDDVFGHLFAPDSKGKVRDPKVVKLERT